MEYFYNQNKNYGYYDQPTHATGHAMAMAALLLGIGALTTSWTFYLSIVTGSLAIIFAVLSKGFDRKMTTIAKAGIGFAVFGIAAALVILTGTLLYLIYNPDVLLDMGRQWDQMIQQVYGQSTESITGFSYEDMMRQFLGSFGR